ncbi:MAG TPA: alanine racemase [Candidatus Eisenbacteria bacterium]|jgi:alanine racemase|nr:alanine racemase [Candidatus Eisenbacteria bacterium]
MEFPTWVEVDLDRFRRNLGAIRSAIGERRSILLVVKADAYGHGAVEIAHHAVRAGAAMLGVATLHEGIELRSSGISAPIVILSPTLLGEVDEILEHRLTPSVTSVEFAERLSARCVAQQLLARFHVEVDTGMGRTGVSDSEAVEFITRITHLPNLKLEGVYTHFPDADSGDSTCTETQVRKFETILRALKLRNIDVPLRHAANSAGLLSVPDSFLDMVRPGILAYGFYPTREVPRSVEVEGIMSFKTRVVQLRDLPPGRNVSYGRTYTTKRWTRIGVLPVGYGHGYPWQLSNRGQVLIRGKRAPIVGRVTMDLTMVDATDIEAALGDEVVLWGEQQGARLGLDEVAVWAQTIPYDLLCSMGKRVVRVYVQEGREPKVLTLIGERQEVEVAESGSAAGRKRRRKVQYKTRAGTGR